MIGSEMICEPRSAYPQSPGAVWSMTLNDAKSMANKGDDSGIHGKGGRERGVSRPIALGSHQENVQI